MKKILGMLGIATVLLTSCGDDDVASTTTTTTSEAPADAEDPTPKPDASLEDVVAARVGDDDLCGAAPVDLLAPPVWELDVEVDGVELVALTCETFAYQSIYVFAGWDGSDLSAVEVEQLVDDEVVIDGSVLGVPGADDDGTISNLERGNGIGTCGELTEWGFDGTMLSIVSVRIKSCDDDDAGDYVESDQWPLVYGGEDVAGEDPESVLELFGTAWSTQDLALMSDLATPQAVTVAEDAGPGDVAIFWNDTCWPDESGAGFCEYGFVPAGQTECCGLLYDVRYTRSSEGQVTITDLSFAGDAG